MTFPVIFQSFSRNSDRLTHTKAEREESITPLQKYELRLLAKNHISQNTRFNDKLISHPETRFVSFVTEIDCKSNIFNDG